MNQLLGEKIAITSDKPQTTRNRIQGVYTQDDTQIVFIDTPGIHKPVHKLGEYMVEAATRTIGLAIPNKKSLTPAAAELSKLIKEL